MSSLKPGASLPPEIVGQFYPQGITEATRLDGGRVNTTFRVADAAGRLTILQKMGPSSDPAQAEDYAVVAERLQGDGWEVAQPLLTSSDSLTTPDETGMNWRGFTFIECDESLPALQPRTLLAFSQMTGRLGLSLARLDYQPKFSIPHFHDFDHAARQLSAVIPQLEPEEQDFCDQLLDSLQKEPPIDGQAHLIHGDPKLTNALYRQGIPFTMVDWDTLMVGDPMLDLADMLRSMTGYLRDDSPEFTASDLLPIVAAYQQGADISEPQDELFQKALSATRVMSLALAMRYMTDSVRQNYFTWDDQHYPTATAHHQAQARRQWGNYQSLL